MRHASDWFCAALGMAVSLLVFTFIHSQLEQRANERDRLRRANVKLQAENERLRRELGTVTAQSLQRPAARAEAQQLSQAAVALHGRWDWSLLVHELMQPFEAITTHMLEAAVRTCFDNGTMYCLRAQVVGGNMYITDYRAIFFDRYYAPARVMPLLETLRRHPNLPDIDIVVAANDEPRIKTLVSPKYWRRLCTAYPGVAPEDSPHRFARRHVDLPPPLFSSTISRHHLDLPWLDFSFFMPRRPHKLRTPPWSVLQPQMVAQSAAVRWTDKIELAMHTGNVGSPFRKRLADVAKRHPSTMLVNELFIGDHGKSMRIEARTPDYLAAHYLAAPRPLLTGPPFLAPRVGSPPDVSRAGEGAPGRLPAASVLHDVRAAVLVQVPAQQRVDRLRQQVQVPAALWLGRHLRARRYGA